MGATSLVPQLRVADCTRFDYASGIASGGCSDIDMLWERNGRFLVIENKRPGEGFSRGQAIALEALAAQPNWSVWVVRGDPPDSIISAGVFGGEQHPMDVSQLRRRIQRWWDQQ